MKEQELRLTNVGAKSTLRSEVTSMAEQRDQPQKAEKKPQGKEVGKPQELTPIHKTPPDSLQEWAKGLAKEQGLDWEKLPLPVRSAFEQHAREFGRPGPGAMAGPPAPSMVVAAELLGGGRELENPLFVERFITDRTERDKFFRSIFELVDASPHEFFQQAFTFENQITLTRFMNVVMKASRDPRLTPAQRLALEEDFERYMIERRLREGTHNVNAILYIPSVKAEQLFEHLQSVESLIGDAAHRVLGVVEMSNILERVLREEMRKNSGYLRPEAITGRVGTEKVPRIDPTGAPVLDAAGNPIYDDVVVKVTEGDVERKVKEIFNEYVVRNNGVYIRDENGQAILINKTFQPWEIDRVFATARATMIMSGRLLSIAAEGKLGEGLSHFASLFLQDILQGYSAIIHTVGKFGITEENLAIFLQDPDEKVKKAAFGLLSLWNPKKYEEAYKEFVNNPKAILESENEFFALQKQNPNRVGDMFTLQSWRFVENPDEPSAVQDFILRGRERMKPRWDAYHPAAPTFDVYEEFIHRTEFVVPRNAKKRQKENILKARKEAWEAVHPGTPTIEEYIKYVNEYFKWVGTAVRFDTMRTTLDKLTKPSNRDGEALKLWRKQIARAKGEDKEKLETADKILERMVRLQPHRLYDKSPDIKKRINARLIPLLFPGIPGLDEAHLTDAQKAVIDKIIDNLYLVEDVLFRDRERLLNEGKTFDSDTLSLNEFLDRITDLTERGYVQSFLDFFVDDYTNNKDKYLVEFVYRRDYKHGFVLWTGDVPLDEYRLTALGPTGSFVRRARDNKTTGEATAELFKLMGKLPEMQSLEQVVPFLRVIYDKIAIYSPDRAKEVIADISLGIAKFVAERPTTNIPGWGFFERHFLKPSFAKIVYGETGLASGATEVRNFFNLLYNKEHLITKEKYKEITKDKVPASKLDMVVNVASTMSQLIALAVLLYFLSELFKKKN